MIGVRTIGHATLIVYDDRPLLATDPWLGGSGAFFGSWQLSHAVPSDEREDLRCCRYLWISHGHPDHLSLESLEELRQAVLLLPDHRGGRIAHELRQRGYDVRVLPDRRWIPLSDRVRVFCVADVMQNAILLVDVNGRLFVNLNDASDRGWGREIRRAIESFRRSHLLKLAPTGNLGVLNLFDEEGRRGLPGSVAADRAGAELGAHADSFGVTHVIPFSSFHWCQRTDSAWANELIPPPEAFATGFVSRRGATLLPPFVEIDCERDDVREIAPARVEPSLLEPEVFGDRWSEPLEREDVIVAARYFREKQTLRDRLGFVALRVGGREYRIELDAARRTGITLEAPRTSLMKALREEVLDDLLLGHFARIQLHGLKHLVPAIVPTVTRFADRGRAQTRAEVDAYQADYERRAAETVLGHATGEGSEGRIRDPSAES